MSMHPESYNPAAQNFDNFAQAQAVNVQDDINMPGLGAVPRAEQMLGDIAQKVEVFLSAMKAPGSRLHV